jgi:hypothetical protein
MTEFDGVRLLVTELSAATVHIEALTKYRHIDER